MAKMTSKPRSAAQYFVRHESHNIVIESQCSYYWAWKPPVGKTTYDDWLRAVRLSARYRRYVRYCNEVLPGWKDVQTIYWADNSVTVEQVCKCGQHTRSVMVDAPHGDVCF